LQNIAVLNNKLDSFSKQIERFELVFSKIEKMEDDYHKFKDNTENKIQNQIHLSNSKTT